MASSQLGIAGRGEAVLEELEQVQGHTADERNDQGLPHKLGGRDEPHVCRVSKRLSASPLT